MIASEARLAANTANSARSTGPSSPEGRAISRRNGFKHGLSGRGIVLPEGDAEEVDRRFEKLRAEMVPRSSAGLILLRQMALLSVRAERAARQEFAAIARNVRHAADDFDEERIGLANELFQGLADDPRGTLRRLEKTPEGVDRLLDAWRDLRDDLTLGPEPWSAGHLERAANLTGLKSRHAPGSRLDALSRGARGDFAILGELDGGDLGRDARQAWAKAALLERIDAEIAALEAHVETLDFDRIELDRAEASTRALFDGSKPAALARRYESEARGGFFKALKEFRLVEAQARVAAEAAEAAAEAVPEPSKADDPGARMGSSRETAWAPDRGPSRPAPRAPIANPPAFHDRDGQPLVAVSPVMTPG